MVSIYTAILIFASKSAQAAVVMYDTRAAWEVAAVGAVSDINLDSYVDSSIAAGTSIGPDAEHTITFDMDLSGVQVPDGWATWSGGFTPVVFSTEGESSITGIFSGDGPMAFGL